MSHTVIKCPGCLSKLRFRADKPRTSIECPRCSEQIDLTESANACDEAGRSDLLIDRKKPVTPGRNTNVRGPAADHSVASAQQTLDSDDSDHEFVDEFIDEDELRAKTESYIFLGLIGIAFLVSLIAFPSAIYYLLQDDETESVQVAGSDVSETNAGTPGITAAASSSPATGANPVEPPALSPQPDHSPPSTPTPRSNADQTTQPPGHAVTATPAPNSAEAESHAASVSPQLPAQPPSPTVPQPDPPKLAQPQPETSAPPLSAAKPSPLPDGRLQYGWAAGKEYVYELRIVADHSSGKQTINGSCTYTVKSEGLQDPQEREGSGSGFVVSSDGVIASRKISSSAASSVGFAVPVNELRKLMIEQQMTVPPLETLPPLEGPELARRISPTVAFIKVWGANSGAIFDVAFSASVTRTQNFDPRRMGFGGFPGMPSSGHDTGILKVSTSGDVVEFNGHENLPYALGPLGQFFIEPLDTLGDPAWGAESTTSLRIVKRADNDPMSRMRSRVPFRPRSGFDPFGRKQEDETVKVIPAVERTDYRLGAELNDRVTIHKNYEFTTTDNAAHPYLAVRGAGEIVFDRKLGMPSSFKYQATLVQNDEDGSVDKLPISVTYTLRDPEVVRKERAEALKRSEEQRKLQEQEKATPNPDLVEELRGRILAAEGGIGALSHLQRLAGLAVVPEQRDAVLELANNHLSNSNGFVAATASDIFCKWSTEEAAEELWTILQDENHLLHNARKTALTRLIEFDVPDLYSRLIPLMSDGRLRTDIRNQLTAAGGAAEQPILDNFAVLSDVPARRELLEVLRRIGTVQSIDFLEELSNGDEYSLKFAAQRALDAIRSRE